MDVANRETHVTRTSVGGSTLQVTRTPDKRIYFRFDLISIKLCFLRN